MSTPRALILRTAGTNCDVELQRAFQLAGAAAERIHLDTLCDEPAAMDEFQLVAFPGGFSYGDDVASGRIFAMKARQHLYPSLAGALGRGVPILGVCNGFQVLTQLGLLPGPAAGEPAPSTAPTPTLNLAENERARFVDTWTAMQPEPNCACVWTKPLIEFARRDGAPDTLTYPSAHGEGRLITADERTRRTLDTDRRIALRYGTNFNGSTDAIAALTDATGLVLGLMPHPERFLDWNRHPHATRLPRELKQGPTPGLMIFQAAVEAAMSTASTIG